MCFTKALHSAQPLLQPRLESGTLVQAAHLVGKHRQASWATGVPVPRLNAGTRGLAQIRDAPNEKQWTHSNWNNFLISQHIYTTNTDSES